MIYLARGLGGHLFRQIRFDDGYLENKPWSPLPILWRHSRDWSSPVLAAFSQEVKTTPSMYLVHQVRTSRTELLFETTVRPHSPSICTVLFSLFPLPLCSKFRKESALRRSPGLSHSQHFQDSLSPKRPSFPRWFRPDIGMSEFFCIRLNTWKSDPKTFLRVTISNVTQPKAQMSTFLEYRDSFSNSSGIASCSTNVLR